MNVILVEDVADKAADIKAVLVHGAAVAESEITVVPDCIQAERALREKRYDLVLLDLVVPHRFGDKPDASNGLRLLSVIESETGIHRPGSVIGITADDVAFNDTLAVFSEKLWFLLRYRRDNDAWSRSIINKITYLRKLVLGQRTNALHEHTTDVAVLAALPSPEYAALKSLPLNWMVEAVQDDYTQYHTATASGPNGLSTSIAACSCTQMGMPAASVAAAKLVFHFRPRYLVMTGICAGYRDMCGVGDVVIADQSWDSGSGKVVIENGSRHFLPEPRAINLHGNLREALSKYIGELKPLPAIEWKGGRPANLPKVIAGPMVSGSAVIAHPAEAASYRHVHRNIAAIDMEAYSVVHAAQHCGYPAPAALILKSVCDFADEKKADDYQAYAAFNSALFFYTLVCDGFFKTNRLSA